MKKEFTLIVASFLLSSGVFAQEYSVEYSAETYAPLTTDTTAINKSETEVIETFTFYNSIPIGFDFVFLGETYDSLSLHENGFAALISEGTSYDSYISIFDCDLKDYQDDPTLSPIVYKTEGAAGSRIFKCEYVSAGYENDAEDNDSISFQLWIYEECNVFEIHVGPGFNDVAETDLYFNDGTSPFIGYGDNSPSVNYNLAGDPTDPDLQTDALMVLDTIPDVGSTYRFFNCVLGVNKNKPSAISIFPNPVSDYMTIEFQSLKEYSNLEIVNISGQIVFSSEITASDIMTLDVAELKSGVYFIQLVNDNGMEAIRFIKE